MAEPGSGMALSREGIEALIPHRAPFLFVDRIESVEYGRRAVGWMDDVGRHQHLLAGHFPGWPVLPGAILVEALAEVGAVAALGLDAYRGKLAVLAGLDGWKFRRTVAPGDAVRLEAELLRLRSTFGRGWLRATVGGKLAAEGELSFGIIDRPAGL
ncbi:MAG TPA: 3-hydroxyacyl-ACP dehydratase FabZ [Chloroflexota bacterium]|nr:3-hydroxyacyl-ACP dehydratase FabZ [Chloroflexota bacterium]